MKIFSESIHHFTKKYEKELKKILWEEMHLKAQRSRFLYKNYYYPLKIVVFKSQSTLGYFDPHTYQIGLNQKLMFGSKDKTIKDILRHEMAHYMCFIEFKNDFKPHGEEFKSICARYGWDEQTKAQMNIDLADELTEGDLKAEKLKQKFRALLKLSESDNPHEAELATLKANQLLIKHNLNKLESEESMICSQQILEAKRKNAKLTAIYDILTHFMVKPIFVYGNKTVFLEVCGSPENIELAEYVANFLDLELENLWKIEKKKGMSGLRAKNSFFTGVARGYSDKVNQMQENFSENDERALLVIKQDLDLKFKNLFNRVSHTTSANGIDPHAMNAGKKAGKSLTINQAIKNKSKNLFIQWSKS